MSLARSSEPVLFYRQDKVNESFSFFFFLLASPNPLEVPHGVSFFRQEKSPFFYDNPTRLSSADLLQDKLYFSLLSRCHRCSEARPYIGKVIPPARQGLSHLRVSPFLFLPLAHLFFGMVEAYPRSTSVSCFLSL